MSAPSSALVVVKVGGSLLEWPGLPDRLAGFLSSRSADRLILIVGGGRAADLIRRLDRIHSLGEERSHALAIRAMDLNAHVLAAMVEGLIVVDAVADLEAVRESGRTPILAPRRFLDEDGLQAEGAGALPHRWDVTSDSIAARVASRLRASELVLLKSAAIPSGVDPAEAARTGLVDLFFPIAAASIPATTYLRFRY